MSTYKLTKTADDGELGFNMIPSTTDKDYLEWLKYRRPEEGSKAREPYTRGASAATLYWSERLSKAAHIKEENNGDIQTNKNG